MTEPTGLARLDRDRTQLMKHHPGWRIWFVPNALDGSVTWCAQPEPTIHAYSTEDLSKDIRLAEEDLAERLARDAGRLGAGHDRRNTAGHFPGPAGTG